MTPTRPLAALGFLLAASLTSAPAADHDILIRNARLFDGTGSPWHRADIAVDGDRITAVGRLGGAGGRVEIDASAMWVMPGFIDGHNHAGTALAESERAAALPLLSQGVTTVFINPDGEGPVDLVDQRARIEAARPAINVAQLVPHNSIRENIIGLDDRDPSESELRRMEDLVRAGMEAGAFGLSAGPFYVPGSYSKTAEHVALARVAARYDGFYTSHIRDESDYSIGLVAAVDEVITVAREARLPGVVTHIKALGPNVWPLAGDVVGRINAARDAGIEIFADQYPYIASSTGLESALVPRWASAGGREALGRRLADAAERARIVAEMRDNLARRAGPAAIMIRSCRSRPELAGRRLDEIARESGHDPVELALEIVADGGAQVISFNMLEENVAAFMRQPWTMTASDGSLPRPGGEHPHPRSFGTFPRKLAVYAVERGVVTPPAAIHSMTGLPSTVFRVPDRGLVRPGLVADLVLIDPETLADRADFDRPDQLATGVVHVLVNGRFAWRDRAPTGERAGRVLRHAAVR